MEALPVQRKMWILTVWCATWLLMMILAQLTPQKTGKTFVVSGGGVGMDHAQLRAMMVAKGWRERGIAESSARGAAAVGLVWVELMPEKRFDPRCYRVHCALKNLLDEDRKQCICNKGELHRLLAERAPEAAGRWLAHTRLLCDVHSVREGEVLILRPVGQWAWAGYEIYHAYDERSLKEGKRHLLKQFPGAIASEYVVDPLTWHGRKCHMRMYWLVRAASRDGSRPFQAELWERGKILTAAAEYHTGDWDNKEVHDSHGHSTPEDLLFPEDLEGADTADLLRQMREALVPVGEVLRNAAVPFAESRDAFEVFGADFLPTRRGTVVLMEVNERVGFQSAHEAEGTDPGGKYAAFLGAYLHWVYDKAIAPLFDEAQAILGMEVPPGRPADH
eukprot:TRINITY_DN2940_c0_g1_i2.p1 TRINITY_DN2940_c0_g1~~TRINITY_DN2940_c0_g1_i2.p1  ORF type:complete len:390 (+),score=74.67 TRINITY_DN2940_c0_g1_i2:272-1441(+)